MIVTVALLLAFNIAQLWRDTNSHAANVRGTDAFAHKKYPAAVKAFEKETSLRPSPGASFNLGTSQIAAGNRELGSATLVKALADPKLRGDAFFNRGSSALAAKAYDHAVRDFAEALRANPRDVGAKRNLEIALAQQRAAQQQAGGSRRNQQGSTQQPQPQQLEERQQRRGAAEPDQLLRSVQQQEQEELSRMHRARPDRSHIGW